MGGLRVIFCMVGRGRGGCLVTSTSYYVVFRFGREGIIYWAQVAMEPFPPRGGGGGPFMDTHSVYM